MKCWSVTLMFVVSAALAQTPCEQLRSLSLPGVAITAAEFVPEKPLDAGGAAVQVRTTLPPHCRVAAVLTPSSDSHIEMEIWLPPRPDLGTASIRRWAMAGGLDPSLSEWEFRNRLAAPWCPR